jgi:hypothetical protein
MSKESVMYHVKAPHNQPFNVNGRRNLTKKNSWWNTASSSHWRNAQKKKDSNKKNA